jgi:hypothetical protein
MKVSYPLVFTALVCALALFSCEKEEESTDTISETPTTTNPTSGTNTLNTANLGSSHNNGKNCLGCHKFSVGGSVYKKDLSSAYPGSVVKLTTLPNGQGTVVATLTTDKSGNIRLSSSVSFGSGLYVSAMGNTTTKHMSSAITSGACNSCHGGATSRVWTE